MRIGNPRTIILCNLIYYYVQESAMLASVVSFLESVFAVARNLLDHVTFWRVDYDEPDLPMKQELSTVKQKTADMATQKKRLEIQKRRIEEQIEKHEEQAYQAVREDREELASMALKKKRRKSRYINEIREQINEIEQYQDKAVERKNELEERVSEFRAKRETFKAKKESERANRTIESIINTQISHSDSNPGLFKQSGELKLAIQRTRKIKNDFGDIGRSEYTFDEEEIKQRVTEIEQAIEEEIVESDDGYNTERMSEDEDTEIATEDIKEEVERIKDEAAEKESGEDSTNQTERGSE